MPALELLDAGQGLSEYVCAAELRAYAALKHLSPNCTA